ncbi:MAG TPA: UDP-3-O-(3-hydroxymyristoyl)glucosamine N-acyltransferase [Polyangiaceae bacterium]|jgi:UDP-3-O-[3-hydroxymyristoyl] glucosamine N-acyltransferase
MLRLRAPATLAELCARGGGVVRGAAKVASVARVEDAGEGDLAPLTSGRFAAKAKRAIARGAAILADEALGRDLDGPVWSHPHASWALAEVLDDCIAPMERPRWGEGCTFGDNVVLGPRVEIGARVHVEAGAVIGRPGFGWATKDAVTRPVPQLGGVVIEDDAWIGPLCTVDAGTLAPTRIRRGAKLDAHVHVGHNCDVGEECIIAAQSGLAGSVVLGRGVLVGGQAGFADHVRVGDGARIAAKSGVIGDVPAGAVVAGYPAQPRMRWLRALARLYRR